MALKYGGKTFRSLEEQVLDNMGNISDLAEQMENFEQFTIEQINLTGTTGTLTADQLTTLQASEQNQIVCDNEIFRLMDNQAESGYLVYGHVGAISSNQTLKTITITLSTRSWILQASTIESSGAKLYAHTCGVNDISSDSAPNYQAYILFYTTDPIPFNLTEFISYIKNNYNNTRFACAGYQIAGPQSDKANIYAMWYHAGYNQVRVFDITADTYREITSIIDIVKEI